MKLEGRVAIVTGAAQGIGRAIAEKLHEEGASIVVADLNGEGAAVAAQALDGLAVEADISSEADTARIAAEALARHGKIDVLVNAAAIVPFIPWDDVDFAYWRKLLSVNLDGAYLISRAVEAPMREAGYGRIVHIASNAFYAGTPNMGPYLAAKGGVVGLTRALATELGRYGITANAVAPGITRTEGALATPHKDAFDFVQALQAIPRHGLPTDIAPAVSFLASEESGWVTGQVLVVDAGHIRD
jgi:NAD(P)-dependent dehydrogenase (short-subunit alcohol dehydrogenase family)